MPSQNSVAKAPLRLVALDGVRGVLALSVAFFHINIWHGQFEQPWLRNFHPVLGFFFVLTGFLLTLLYDQRLKDGKSAAVVYRFLEAPSRDLFAKLGTRIRRGEIGWPKAMQRFPQESG